MDKRRRIVLLASVALSLARSRKHTRAHARAHRSIARVAFRQLTSARWLGARRRRRRIEQANPRALQLRGLFGCLLNALAHVL